MDDIDAERGQSGFDWEAEAVKCNRMADELRSKPEEIAALPPGSPLRLSLERILSGPRATGASLREAWLEKQKVLTKAC